LTRECALLSLRPVQACDELKWTCDGHGRTAGDADGRAAVVPRQPLGRGTRRQESSENRHIDMPRDCNLPSRDVVDTSRPASISDKQSRPRAREQQQLPRQSQRRANLRKRVATVRPPAGQIAQETSPRVGRPDFADCGGSDRPVTAPSSTS